MRATRGAAQTLDVMDGEEIDLTAGQTEGARSVLQRIPGEVLETCIGALAQIHGSSLRSLGVTSVARGEGKSSVALAMAIAQATQYGRKTLLVELDAVEPTLARRLNLADCPGVADLIDDGGPVEGYIRWVADNLGVVVAGSDGSGEPFTAMAAGHVLTLLATSAEVVVLELPPIGPGAGGAPLAALCGTLALVVRAGGLAITDIEAAAARLPVVPFVILNGARSRVPKILRRVLSLSS